MRKIKIGIRKKTVDYAYKEYCFAIIRYNRKYYLIKNNKGYTLIGDLIRKKEGRKECIARIIKDRTDINLVYCDEYVTIDEYNELAPNKGLENFTTFYLIDIDKPFKYKPIHNEELVLLTKEELNNIELISYQKEAIKILLASYIFN